MSLVTLGLMGIGPLKNLKPSGPPPPWWVLALIVGGGIVFGFVVVRFGVTHGAISYSSPSGSP